MPAQNITDTIYTDDLGKVTQYSGCTSQTFYFTVQTDQVLAGLLNGYPWAQLPNSNVYWSYPINDNNREWHQISGDWTGVTSTMATVNSPTQLRWQPYGLGPNTAHIVWTNQVKTGGIIGGDYGSTSYVGSTTVYAAPTSMYVIMDGKVYCNILNTQPYGQAFGQFRCWDEQTGQVLYTANGSISYGIHLPGSTFQQSSTTAASEGGQVLLANSFGSYVQPYLWGSVVVNGITYWNYYDALTGVLVRQISNASSARLIDGTVLAFGCGVPTGQTQRYVYRWNMTSVASSNDWWTGVTWKVPMPNPLAQSKALPTIFAVSSDLSTIVVWNYYQYWAFNANTGASLWNMTLNYQVNTNEEIPLANGVDDFIVIDPTAATFNCYSMKTGALLWTTPSFASSPWATTWTIYYTETNDLNNMYFAFPDGSMRAYSLTDGHLVWTSAPIASTEYANNAVPFVHGGTVLVDGKLYEYGGYSIGYEIDPVPRFAVTVCINATTGDTIWVLNGGVLPNAAANGYVLGSGIFDGLLYCLGKGPSSTTVTAQQQVGGSVLIQGSVLDTSPASSSATLSAMFANGVPAVSDANMSVWMDYLHMQNSTLLNSPPICTGVPVTLTAVDPNGNVNVIGTATSNYQGNYGLQWTPTTPGLYTIYATFAGSNSYYTSSASTDATVSTAATPTSTPMSTSTAQSSVSNSDLVTYLIIVAIAIILAIAIVGALLLRKK